MWYAMYLWGILGGDILCVWYLWFVDFIESNLDCWCMLVWCFAISFPSLSFPMFFWFHRESAAKLYQIWKHALSNTEQLRASVLACTVWISPPGMDIGVFGAPWCKNKEHKSISKILKASQSISICFMSFMTVFHWFSWFFYLSIVEWTCWVGRCEMKRSNGIPSHHHVYREPCLGIGDDQGISGGITVRCIEDYWGVIKMVSKCLK